jgi:DNA topoisomerase-1
MAVTDLLVANLPKIMDIKFTAHMEEDLDKIASGELDRDVLLREFYKTFETDLEKFLGETKKTKKVIEIKR